MSDQVLLDLVQRFKEQLKAKVNYPGLVGYYGWNYEAAVALEALAIEDPNQVKDCLKRALTFPHAGYFLSKKRHAAWLYSVGDRIGLFGSLYNDIDQTVYSHATEGCAKWPRHKGLFLRNLGWGAVFGIRPSKVWIWADDIFMGGIPLLKEKPEMVLEMLRGAKECLRDDETKLWWHGVKINATGKVIANNGMKWGRAHGWIVLTYARYADVVQTEESYEMLRAELENTKRYQRESGAFGNLVDVKESDDESSLTTCYVYGVGVLHARSEASSELKESADKAWNWLCTLESKGFSLSKTTGACHLSTKASTYNSAFGFHSGPAVAFVLWAKLGRDMLDA